MEIHDQLLEQEIIRHRLRKAMNGSTDDVALKEAFKNAMRPRMLKLLAKRKAEMELLPQDEGLRSFLHTLGHGLAHAAAEPIASGLGVSSSSVVKLGKAAFSKSKSTTKTKKPKRVTAKLKTSNTVSASTASHTPVTKASLMTAKTPTAKPKVSSVLSRTKSSLKGSTAGYYKPAAATYTVAAINKFKQQNRQKIRKISEEPTEGDDHEES